MARLIDLRGDGALFIGYNGEHEVWSIDPDATVDAIPVEWIKETKGLAQVVGVWQYELFLETLLKDWAEHDNDSEITKHQKATKRN